VNVLKLYFFWKKWYFIIVFHEFELKKQKSQEQSIDFNSEKSNHKMANYKLTNLRKYISEYHKHLYQEYTVNKEIWSCFLFINKWTSKIRISEKRLTRANKNDPFAYTCENGKWIENTRSNMIKEMNQWFRSKIILESHISQVS